MLATPQVTTPAAAQTVKIRRQVICNDAKREPAFGWLRAWLSLWISFAAMTVQELSQPMLNPEREGRAGCR
ncbi:hypothetical protein, partial [Rhizobium ecuadorense]|uniref:hypothetical protein n=1 Tax=Rhizobium ecuadorense TaxID=1671795 RepID=UPI001AEC4792